MINLKDKTLNLYELKLKKRSSSSKYRERSHLSYYTGIATVKLRLISSKKLNVTMENPSSQRSDSNFIFTNCLFQLKCKKLDNKEFSGTWTSNYFTLLITRYMPKSFQWNSYIFVFDALSKLWCPLTMPKHIKLIKSPLLGFSNNGNDDNHIIVFYAKGTAVPKQIIRMPIKLETSFKN